MIFRRFGAPALLLFAAILTPAAAALTATEHSAAEGVVSAARTTFMEVQTRISRDSSSDDLALAEASLKSLLAELQKVAAGLRESLTSGENELAAVAAARSDPTVAHPELDDRTTRDTERDVQRLTATLTRERELMAAANAVITDVAQLLGTVTATARGNRLQVEVDARRAMLEQIQAELSSEDVPADLLALRERLRSLRSEAEAATAPLTKSLETLRADLDRLGPAAAEGADSTETAEIAQERQRLARLVARDDALVRQAQLNIGEANRLLDRIAELRRDQFYGEILTRDQTPLAPGAWLAALPILETAVRKTTEHLLDWRAERQAYGTFGQSMAAIAVSLSVGLLLFGPVRRWANRRVLDRLETLEPTRARRALAALIRVLVRAVPGIAAGAVVYMTLYAQGLLNGGAAPLAQTLWGAVVGLLVADAGATATFAPYTPGWQLVPVPSNRARPIRFLLVSLVAVFFADRLATKAGLLFGGGPEVALIQSALTSLLMAVLLLFLTRDRLWKVDRAAEKRVSLDLKNWGKNLRVLIRATAWLTIGATLFGYVALAHYVVTSLFMLCGLAGGGLFVRVLLQEGARAIDHRLAAEAANAHGPRRGEPQERLMLFWIGVLIDLLLVAVLIPPALIILGAEWPDVRDGVRDALVGFQIGSVTISIAGMFAAFAAFVAILGLTRFVQRLAEKRFFPQLRVDIGVSNSLSTLINYLGLVVAFMTGVSMLGFRLENLAIIAGALSVGIGFGLQSIVNNFVSGLILLFERPIKVGDWIVTTSGEGTVKRISVRSTEIETFDRSSVIVPNSELISSAVTNWTHKNKLGRLIVPVGVSYKADPKTVIEVLEGVLRDDPSILDEPPPYVYFDAFGDSSLNFQLRGFIRDITQSLSIRTQLRVAVYYALKDAGIEIPFPQRDLHLRTPAAATATEPAADEASEANRTTPAG